MFSLFHRRNVLSHICMNLVVWLHHLWPNLIWWLHTGWGNSSWHQRGTKSRVHPNLGSQFQERILFVNNWIGLATCCHATLVHVAQLGPQHVPNLSGHWNKGSPHEKKNVFFWALPELPLPPPLPPIWATCTTFFGRQKRRFSAYYRTK